MINVDSVFLILTSSMRQKKDFFESLECKLKIANTKVIIMLRYKKRFSEFREAAALSFLFIKIFYDKFMLLITNVSRALENEK